MTQAISKFQLHGKEMPFFYNTWHCWSRGQLYSAILGAVRSTGTVQDYEVDLYLRESWLDSRLANTDLSRPLDLNDPKLVQMIWKPEVFFANAKHAEFQYVTVPNVLVRINPSGEILYMLRLKLRFSCMMDLYRYPMDFQVCAIELASFSKTTDELHLQWSLKEAVKLDSSLKLPQFEIEKVNTSLCKEKFHIGKFFHGRESFPDIGEFSCLKAEFYLKRSLGFYLVQSYLPTILIVVISWVSFWLDVDAIPARITLGVTTLLTISSKGAGIQANLPPVSYVKAIDVWMGACTTFVFTALLEFTLVNYLWRTKRSLRAAMAGASLGKLLGKVRLTTSHCTLEFIICLTLLSVNLAETSTTCLPHSTLLVVVGLCSCLKN
ncbi:hypothetical protein LAZ67_2000111, partial [Cordylochernes scorpioides]